MLMRRHGAGYNFIGDTETGITMRWGRDANEDPLWAPWPELADISISNHCTAGCPFCYRDSRDNRSFMPVADYEQVLDALTSPRWGSVFQVALGGGEPLEHPEFEEILRSTARRGIMANFTTNGRLLTPQLAQRITGLVGAAAISTADLGHPQSEKAAYLTDAGIRANLHFILDAVSIEQATELLDGRFNSRFDSVNAIVFLTYKPRGRADTSRCLKPGPSLDRFLQKIKDNQCSVPIGFDACFVPLLLNRTQIATEFVDSCECAFFSVYVDELLNVRPCSFATGGRDAWNLQEHSMKEIWEWKFAGYRKAQLEARCQSPCRHADACHGYCAYFDELHLCYSRGGS
jgi:radical SAM protein with 4Fe4S-binding SPASM domain